MWPDVKPMVFIQISLISVTHPFRTATVLGFHRVTLSLAAPVEDLQFALAQGHLGGPGQWVNKKGKIYRKPMETIDFPMNYMGFSCIFSLKPINWNKQCCLVVYLPLWKMWKSIGMIIPYLWNNKKCSKPPTRMGENHEHVVKPKGYGKQILTIIMNGDSWW